MAPHVQTSGSHLEAILDPEEGQSEETTAPHEYEEEQHEHGEKHREHEGKQERARRFPTQCGCAEEQHDEKEMLNARKQEGQR